MAVGAHPGYPDPAGFGRELMHATPEQLRQWVTQQIEILSEIATRRGLRLAHVKPHGVLYNLAARDIGIAAVIAEAVARWTPDWYWSACPVRG